MQSYFMQWLHMAHREVYNVTFSIPNGGYQLSIITAMRLKREGLKAGTPDLFIAYPNGDQHGMFIEFKYDKGEPTDAQREMMGRLNDQGYYCTVCYSWREASLELDGYLGIT